MAKSTGAAISRGRMRAGWRGTHRSPSRRRGFDSVPIDRARARQLQFARVDGADAGRAICDACDRVLVGSAVTRRTCDRRPSWARARSGACRRAIRNGTLDQRVSVRGRDELADLARSFNAMSSDLAGSEQRRRQLLSDVSHELRTPLTNVIGAIEAIQDGLRPAGAAELAAIHDEAMLLVRLVYTSGRDACRRRELRCSARRLDSGELRAARRSLPVSRSAPSWRDAPPLRCSASRPASRRPMSATFDTLAPPPRPADHPPSANRPDLIAFRGAQVGTPYTDHLERSGSASTG